ncbi:MAG: hypothetical protein AB7O74_16905 [Candidatus Nanopelagicales bacterium]
MVWWQKTSDGYEPPTSIPEGSALDLVHYLVTWDRDQFGKTRLSAKRRAKRAQAFTSGLTLITAVVATAATVVDPSWWGVVIVAISSLSSFLAIREAHVNNRGIWLSNTATLARLQALERRIALAERLPDRSGDDALAQSALAELGEIRADSVVRWERLDRAPIGGAK